jgi:hypothetical protein
VCALRQLIAPIARPVRDRAEVVADRLRGVRRDTTDSLQGAFTEIYRRRSWTGESVSGPGSDDAETAAIREALPAIFRELSIRTLVDVPCGDANWITRLGYPFDAYTGIDIVAALVADIAERHAGAGRTFLVGDLCNDPLPRADAVLCRDCLVHLPVDAIHAALANVKRSGATWLLTTTFPDHRSNPDIRPGRWRPLNLQAPPFSLPAPERLIAERFTRDARFADKALGVWRVSSLP